MGTSNWQNISYCVGLIRHIRPSSLLDVGVGFGRWGVLAREFVDAWEGREARSDWQLRLEGIEAFANCLTPLHDYVYDRMHVGDAVDLLPSLGTYDVIYLGDVVEHQTRERGQRLLDAALEHALRAVIVTVPIGEQWRQGMAGDHNPHHPHRSSWMLADFDRFTGASRRVFSDAWGRPYLVAVLSASPANGTLAARHQSPVVRGSGGVEGRATTGGPPGAEPGSPTAGVPPIEPLSGEFLDRIDENLTCLRLIENEALGVDKDLVLLTQMPASTQIERHLAALTATSLPWSEPLHEMVDSLYRCLAASASREDPLSGLEPLSPLVRAALDSVARVLGSLADAHGAGVSRTGPL